MKRLITAFVFFVMAFSLLAQEPAIDWQRAQALHRKAQNGEKLSAEDQAYLDRAKELRRTQGRGRPTASKSKKDTPAGGALQHFTPLTELVDGEYQGEKGGLYGGGRNDPPREIQAAAAKETGKIRPLDAAGQPSDNGKVVLLTLGMSNTTMESSRFKEVARADSALAPELVIVDGAQGGKDARITSEESAPFWKVVETRLKSANVTASQVQVIWLKQAVARPTGNFSEEASRLKGYLEKIVQIAKKRYPNLRIIYLSSRTYAGYAETQLNPEPYAYESAFAVRRLILEQDKNNPKLEAPVLLWGPYLWTDGVTPRKSDGLVWKKEDTREDGTHPSDSGRQKVAEQLLKFFKTDANTKLWFLKTRG